MGRSLQLRSVFVGCLRRLASNQSDGRGVEPRFAFIGAQFAKDLEISHGLLQVEFVADELPVGSACNPFVPPACWNHLAAFLIITRLTIREPIPGGALARLALANH